jgi:hypothetical protein
MTARIAWGSAGDDPALVDPDAVARADEDDFSFLERGEVGDAPVGPGTEEEGAVPAERLIYLVEDDGGAEPIAVVSARVVGSADVLAAVEQEWKARTGSEP